MSVAIVTDSTASLHAGDAARMGIEVVPLQVVIGADTFTESLDATPAMIATALASFVPVSTSRPSPERFLAAYERLAAAGATSVVSVHLSSRISGTLESAALAARRSPVPVVVVDSTQVGIATGFAATRAAQARDRGEDAARVAEAARRAGERSTTLLYVDSLEYLRRGGRVGGAAALIGSALAVKPLLTVADGLVVPLERVRTSARAVARLQVLACRQAGRHPQGVDVGVQHLANAAVAHSVAERLAEVLGQGRIRVDEVGAVIGAHVGPGMVAVTLTPRD